MIRMPAFQRRAALLALALAFAGCQPLGLFAGSGNSSTTPLASPDGKAVVGQNGLVSNNAASLSGSVRGPATLVSNNSASYRAQAYAEGVVPRALVYLTTPDERFYAGSDGKALFAMTDDQGRYAFGKAPAGEPVIVTVLLAQNRRLVGFLVPSEGQNAFDVDLATTVVAEFLRDQARLAHRTMSDYPKFRQELPELLRMTRELIESGELAIADIGVNAIPAMRHAYVRAFGADHKALGDAWERVLGYRPLLVDELEVGVESGKVITAVATQGDAVYVAATNQAFVSIVERKGTTTRTLYDSPVLEGPFQRVNAIQYLGDRLFVGAAGAGLSVFDGSAAFDGANPYAHLLHQVREGTDKDAAPLSLGAAAVHVEGDDVYVASDTTHEVFRYKIDPASDSAFVQAERLMGDRNHRQGVADDFEGDAAKLGAAVHLNLPLALAKHGNDLYVADTLHHRIRKLDLTTRLATTALGSGSIPFGNVLRPPGALEDGKLPESAAAGYADLDDPAGVPKEKAFLAYPHTVLVDAQGRLFVADTDHRRVRMMVGDRVYTVAGTEAGAPEVSGDSRRAGLGEVWGMAFDADGNLLIADGRSNKLRRLWLNPKQ